jgi:hypothetical protein
MARSVVAASTLLVAALASPPRGLADEDRSVAAPRFVRISAPAFAGSPILGDLVAIDDETIVVQDSSGQDVAVPAEQVTQMEVRRQAGRRGKGALTGALTGLVAGAVVGVAAGEDCSGKDLICFDRGGTALVLGAAGALVGAGIGALVAPGEKWEVVDRKGVTLTMSPLLGRHRTVGMLLKLDF